MRAFSIVNFILLVGFSTADLPPSYLGLSAQDKQEVLWSKISEKPYSMSSLPTDEPGFFQLASLLRPSFDAVSFTHANDEFPNGRQKLIHVHGSAAKVELKIFDNSTYTGIFKSGGIGIARLSLAKQDYKNFIPGMGLKILIDGQRSQNFQVMYSLDGQGSNHNFFQNPFKNVIAPPSTFVLKVLSHAFSSAIEQLPGGKRDRPENMANLGLYEQASVESSGLAPGNVKAPYVITFIPNAAVGWNPENSRDVRENLDVVPAGSLLYTVAVRRTLTAPDEIIGQLRTTSRFVASEYEDQSLFFQHAAKRWRA